MAATVSARMAAYLRHAWLFLLATCLPASTTAQVVDGTLALPSGIDVTGQGWGQLGQTGEMAEFILALVETTLLTATFAFHPTTLSSRRGTKDWQVPRTMFLFAFIGMFVGFLVVHHGYLIGFVIFGIGGLFRFRMDSSSLFDSGQLVLVSLLGLAIGLNLPVVALIAGAGAWAVILFFGPERHLTLEVKFDERASFGTELESLEKALGARGYRVISATKSKSKPVVDLEIRTPGRNGRSAVVSDVAEIQAARDAISDWHVE